MRKAELTEQQMGMVKLVRDKLGDTGWTFDEWPSQFDAGENVYPELFVQYKRNAHVNLYFTYSFDPEHVSVLIERADETEHVDFRVYPENKLGELLELIIKWQDVMTYSDYPRFVREMRDLCGKVFWEEQGLEGPLVTDEELESS